MAEEYDVSKTPTVIIMAVKGGVGKSVVTANIALRLKKFLKIGLLDVDIDSPNLPEILNIRRDMKINEQTLKFFPVEYDKDMRLFSMGCYHTEGLQAWANDGVVNKDIIVHGLVNTAWGNTQAFLVDLPAGSSDEMNAVLSAFKNIVGAIIVTEPATESDMMRCFELCTYLVIPIIGVIENKQGAITECGVDPICPACKKIFNPMGESNIKNVCEERGIVYLGNIPIVSTLTEQIQKGEGPLLPKGADKAINKALEVIKPLVGYRPPTRAKGKAKAKPKGKGLGKAKGGKK